MSTETPTVNQPTVTTEHSFTDSLETFTSAVTDLLAEADVASDDELATIREASSELVDEAEQIEATVHANDEATDETKALVAETRKEQADVRSDVHELTEAVDDGKTGEEADVGGSTPTPTTGETAVHEPVTPLGDVVTLPETLATAELTANVKRTRDVAADVVDYGRSVPAGYAVTSSELRTVLTALKDGDGRTYTETVGRVIEYLDELGGDDVEVKETMGGERTVIFSEAFVKRTVAWRNGNGNSVVTDTRATG